MRRFGKRLEEPEDICIFIANTVAVYQRLDVVGKLNEHPTNIPKMMKRILRLSRIDLMCGYKKGIHVIRKHFMGKAGGDCARWYSCRYKEVRLVKKKVNVQYKLVAGIRLI